MTAILALEDGRVFHGESFGAPGTTTGEVCFNTSMTGYQEILTDPSYRGQIIAMTYPEIGNYGVNGLDVENDLPQVRGFVIEELSPVVSNWRSDSSLDAYLKKHGIPGIQGIDTRALTKKLRVDGAMKCCLSTLPITDAAAIQRAKSWQDMAGADYVQNVSCKEPFIWSSSEPANYNAAYLPVGTTMNLPATPARRFRVAAFDYGAKFSIFRKLAHHGFDVQVFPATATAEPLLEPPLIMRKPVVEVTRAGLMMVTQCCHSGRFTSSAVRHCCEVISST